MKLKRVDFVSPVQVPSVSAARTISTEINMDRFDITLVKGFVVVECTKGKRLGVIAVPLSNVSHIEPEDITELLESAKPEPKKAK